MTTSKSRVFWIEKGFLKLNNETIEVPEKFIKEVYEVLDTVLNVAEEGEE